MGYDLRHQHPPILLPLQIHTSTHVPRLHNHNLRLRQPLHWAPGPPRLHLTKGAIVAFTRALSNQQIENGIRVNAVCPGPIWTPLIPATMNEKAQKEFTSPMGRPGQPSEVATCFVFLASADSSFISGQSLHPNGGVIVGS